MSTFNLQFLTSEDLKLVEAAREVIRKNFDAVDERHTVGAAILCSSGKIYTAVNVYANCGFGPCADSVCLGTAISTGEREFVTFAGVGGPNRNFGILPPCGNCRQLLLEYGPNLQIVISNEQGLHKISISDLLPFAYKMQFGQGK